MDRSPSHVVPICKETPGIATITLGLVFANEPLKTTYGTWHGQTITIITLDEIRRRNRQAILTLNEGGRAKREMNTAEPIIPPFRVQLTARQSRLQAKTHFPLDFTTRISTGPSVRRSAWT